jgi:hypothetical protein
MVICGFPGIGKTFTVQNWIYSNIKIYDSDSSNFSWIDKNDHSKDFPTNYIEYIKSIGNENSVVLTSSHKEVRDALKAAGINYYVVYPNLESFGKDFYLDRICGRENGIYPGDIRFKVNDCFCKRDNVIWIERGSFDEG